MRQSRALVAIGVLFLLVLRVESPEAWNNGQTGNTTTNTAAECDHPPYATHDWIPDHALALLPANEREWLEPHRTMYLLGTEAPDNRLIPAACGAPNTGYDDRSKGHSVEWDAKFTKMVKDRAAVRAQEEYDKAAAAFRDGNPSAAAYYLGAMAHYIGDASQYGHAVTFETKQHHSAYESFVAKLTASFDGGTFESHLNGGALQRRTPHEAVERISRMVAKGDGKILSARRMEALYTKKGPAYMDSIGAALNVGVAFLADVLHTFFLDVVQGQ